MREGWWRECDATHQRTPLEEEIELAHREGDRIIAIVAPESREAAPLEPFRIDTDPVPSQWIVFARTRSRLTKRNTSPSSGFRWRAWVTRAQSPSNPLRMSVGREDA